jgi:hypothetical protein
MDENAKSLPLPLQIARGASLRGKEYGWELEAFSDALRNGEALGYACVGGQFQFRIADDVYEMYWLNADASERIDGEAWSCYCHRSCGEVMERFNTLAANTNFRAEAANWVALSQKMTEGFDLRKSLVFVAYFVAEQESQRDTRQ